MASTTYLTKLKAGHACSDGIDYVKNIPVEKAWSECTEPNYMAFHLISVLPKEQAWKVIYRAANRVTNADACIIIKGCGYIQNGSTVYYPFSEFLRKPLSVRIDMCNAIRNTVIHYGLYKEVALCDTVSATETLYIGTNDTNKKHYIKMNERRYPKAGEFYINEYAAGKGRVSQASRLFPEFRDIMIEVQKEYNYRADVYVPVNYQLVTKGSFFINALGNVDKSWEDFIDYGAVDDGRRIIVEKVEVKEPPKVVPKTVPTISCTDATLYKGTRSNFATENKIFIRTGECRPSKTGEYYLYNGTVYQASYSHDTNEEIVIEAQGTYTKDGESFIPTGIGQPSSGQYYVSINRTNVLQRSGICSPDTAYMGGSRILLKKVVLEKSEAEVKTELIELLNVMVSSLDKSRICGGNTALYELVVSTRKLAGKSSGLFGSDKAEFLEKAKIIDNLAGKIK